MARASTYDPSQCAVAIVKMFLVFTRSSAIELLTHRCSRLVAPAITADFPPSAFMEDLHPSRAAASSIA